jgi:hypothetical protein
MKGMDALYYPEFYPSAKWLANSLGSDASAVDDRYFTSIKFYNQPPTHQHRLVKENSI